VDDSLPVVLLHLREAELVRLCGLARAARGQDYARTGRVRQAEREAGTLRATALEGETTQEVSAHFSDSGLDVWECTCSPVPPGQTAAAPEVRAPCEHVAALLSLWVREPGQFRVAPLSPAAFSANPLASAPEAPEMPPLPGLPAPAIPVPSELAAAPVPSLASLEHLDENLRRFLNLLALAGGSVTEHEALRLFGRLELGEPEAALASLEQLRQHGFVQPIFAAAPASRQAAAAKSPAGWSIPETLLEHLPRVLPLAPLPEVWSPESGLREQRAEPTLPALLVLVVAQMVDRGAPLPLAAASQQPSSRSTFDLDAGLAQQWAPQLKTTPDQVRFCLALLRLQGMLPSPAIARAPAQQAAALARPAISSEQARETLLRAYRVLLARPETEVGRDLFTHWLHAPHARELMELRDAGVRVAWLSRRETRPAPNIDAENQAARQFIIDLLRRVPAGRWWSFRSFVEFVWRFQPAFLRGRQQTFLRPQWWLERLPEGQPLSMEVRADWRQAEGRYIALLVRRALHWLGAVDLALDEQGRLKGFRITPLGSLLFTSSASAEDAPAPVILPPASALPAVLQPQDDGTLLVSLAALDGERLETLLWWCDPAGATAEALRFRPSAERVAAALDAGQDFTALLAWLEEQPQSAALSALVAQVRRWAALYGQVRLSASVTLLEVGDPALWSELEATLDLSAQFVDHSLAPGLAVLRPAAAGGLVEEMQRRGYTPWITDDEAADRP
jgi:hypothetical protein